MMKQGQIRSRISLISYVVGLALSFVHPVLGGIFYLLPVIFNIIPGSLNLAERIFGFEIV